MALLSRILSRDEAQSLVDQLQAEYRALREQDASRLARYTDAVEDYERPRDPDRIVTGDTDDYGRSGGTQQRRRHAIPLPYTHAITAKHAFRIAGRLPDILVPAADSTRLERHRADTIEKIVYGAYRYSQAPVQIASGAHHASLLGAACFDVWFNVERQMPKFRELHPGTVLVVPGVDDLHDFERVYRFWTVSLASLRARYRGRELPGGVSIDDVQPDEVGSDRVTIVEVTGRSARSRFAGNVLLSEYQHDYGFCPYVVIPNLGPVEELWGYSDYEFFKDIAAYFEKLLSRQADVAQGTANGAMQDFGSGQNPKSVIEALRKGGVIPVKKDSGGLKPVETPQFGPWIDAHFNYVRSAINDLGFAPPAAWGTLGASTSGADRALQLGPQLELTGLKQIHWTSGLQRLNSMILKLVEQKTTGKATYRGTQTKGHRATPFTVTLNAAAEAEPLSNADPNADESLNPLTGEPQQLPMTPKDLIDGDYDTCIEWQNRLERDDPQFVLQELNKFQQGAQSLYTTLERLGVADPEDEMRLIEEEAARFPWLRNGMIALLQQQLDAQNQQSDPSQQGGDLSASIASMTGGGGGQAGALNFDALSSALNGSANGGGRSPSSVPGAPNGGA